MWRTLSRHRQQILEKTTNGIQEQQSPGEKPAGDHRAEAEAQSERLLHQRAASDRGGRDSRGAEEHKRGQHVAGRETRSS